MKGIFHPDRRFWEEEPWPSVQEVRNLDLKEDRCYLEYMVQYARGSPLTRLMKKLGISELPEKTRNLDDPSDREYEVYFVLEEQVAREPDAEILKEAAYEASTQMAKFAFCRLTKYCYPSPWNDAYSYRTYECGWKEGMTTEDVIEFCREMITVQGPFAREAEEILADPPRDHNDYNGNRMASHERAKSEPPYVRKERLAPFRESAEYEQSRAEVLQLEAQAHEATTAGDAEKAVMLLAQMSSKSEQLGKYTQRWDAIDDYVRCCIAWSEVSNYADGAEEAAGILRRLIKARPGRKNLQGAAAESGGGFPESRERDCPADRFYGCRVSNRDLSLASSRSTQRSSAGFLRRDSVREAERGKLRSSGRNRRPARGKLMRKRSAGLKSGGRSRDTPRVRLKTTRSIK